MDDPSLQGYEIDEGGRIRGPGERGFELISGAEEASANGDVLRAEELYKEAIAFERINGIDLGYSLSRYANFLFDQGRLDESASILEEAMGLGTDIPYSWGLYLTILARRRDIPRMLEVYELMPFSIVGDRGMAGALLGYASVSPHSDEADLNFAEQLSATVRDQSAERGEQSGVFSAAGVHGVVLERMGRIDEAITEWQDAFSDGSTDAKTADRLTLNLDKTKRFEEAADVCRSALQRGLPANTEDTLRKRLERLERKVTPGGSKKDVPAFSVRTGEGYASLLLQQRLSPPLRDLAVHEQIAYCLAFMADAGIVTRVDLETGEQSRTEGLPPLNEIRISPSGWGIGIRREGRVGDGSTQIAFLTPSCEVYAAADLHDSLSQVSYAANRWFIGCRDGRLYAYDLSGNLLWDWVTPGSETYDDENPYFRPCPYYVSAVEQFVAIASFDKVYAIDFTGQTMWQIDVPDKGPLTFTSAVEGNQTGSDAWRTLDLEPGASDAEVKKAYRAMVFATHPDHNPGSPSAARDFRRVQRAYEDILAGKHQSTSSGITVTVTITLVSSVSGLIAAANTILISSSDGVLSAVDASGRLVSRRVLGGSRVIPALLPNGTLAATFCDGTLSFYEGDDIVNAVPVGDQYPSALVPWRDDIVFVQGSAITVFDRAGRNVWSLDFPKRLANVVVNDRFLICGAGALDVFERVPIVGSQV